MFWLTPNPNRCRIGDLCWFANSGGMKIGRLVAIRDRDFLPFIVCCRHGSVLSVQTVSFTRHEPFYDITKDNV